jgi:putative nucleotidyltransferase with HDIG domain
VSVSAQPISVLVVDDDPQVCEVIRIWLNRRGLDCITTPEDSRAREILLSGRVKVLLADIMLSGSSGLDLLAYARANAPECRVILISGLCETDHLASALSLGAFDYIMKPLDMEQLEETVCQAMSAESDADSRHLPRRAARAMQLEAQFRQASLDSIRALVHAVEAKDPYTRLHSEHVSAYAVDLAEYSVPSIDTESVRIAALLHDIGKIGVPDQILTKPGALTQDEFEFIRRHPVLGGEILANIPLFAREAMFVRHHHERWDGKGYPDGLMAEEVPLGSRIIHVADAMDAMLMSRTYKEAYPIERVLDELARGAGTQFDPYLATKAIEWCHDRGGRLILAETVN